MTLQKLILKLRNAVELFWTSTKYHRRLLKNLLKHQLVIVKNKQKVVLRFSKRHHDKNALRKSLIIPTVKQAATKRNNNPKISLIPHVIRPLNDPQRNPIRTKP